MVLVKPYLEYHVHLWASPSHPLEPTMLQGDGHNSLRWMVKGTVNVAVVNI